MVHTFKFGGQRIAYDSVSGLVLPLTELAYKMLDYIELPMAKECSSALRYDLAKFDSAAISDTYNELYALYRDGKLFAEGESEVETVGGAALMVGDVLCTRDNPHVLEIAKSLADEDKDAAISVVWAPEGEAAFIDEEIPAILKELEKLAKEQVKRARGDIEGKPLTAFKSCCAAAHTDESCAHCWANKLCSLTSPHKAMCELECKRIECVMMCETSAKSE
ncbi:MAG: hypothetical protein IJ428_01930 [Clostridia bacterium]|nr:hypothetical protein [Clostridia bacterium]